MDGMLPLGRRVALVTGLILLTAFVVPHPTSAQVPPTVEPIIGPERPVAYPVPGTPQSGFAPAVAFGASIYLVVWNDGKAARVDQAGTPIDPSPIHLGLGSTSDPDVAFDGENFLVVSNPADQSQDQPSGVQAVRVSPGGEVLDASPIAVSGPQHSATPKVVFDGTNHLVVWGSPDGVERAVVSPAGIVIEPVALLAPTSETPPLDVAFNGSHHLVTWSHRTDIGHAVSGMLVDRSGSAVTPDGFPITDRVTTRSNPTVTSFGSSFLVAWDHHDSGDGSTLGIHAARVDGTGSVLDPTGIPIGFGLTPVAASDGADVLVVWWSLSSTVGARVTPSGDVLDPSGVPVSTLETLATVAFGGTDHLVVGLVGQAVSAARVTPAGAVLDPVAVLISLGANSQGFPHAASDGTNTLVTWFDHRRGGGGLYGGRVGPDGQVLDGQGFLITDAGGFGGATAFDGTDFLVAWTGPDPSDRSRNTIQLARVSRAGVVLDRFPVATAADGETISEPTLAFGGATLLVAYYRRDAGRPFNAQLEATLIGPDPASGVVVAEGFLGFDFDVVHGPGGFLFAVTADRPAVSIFGTLVTTSGTIVTPSWFPIAPVGQGLPSQPQVAANGEHYLVAWTAVTDPSDEIGGSTIRGARVDGSGTVLDPTGIPIAAGPGRKDEPSVAANGPFLVTWRDRRRDPSGDLYATRVDPDGAVARPDGFEIGSSTLSRPALAPGVGVGTFTFAYSRYVPEQPYGANRVFTRTVNPK